MAVFTFTCGDINGIGPEIAIKTLNSLYGREDRRFIFICPENIFKETAQFIKPEFEYRIVDRSNLIEKSDQVVILDTGYTPFEPGKPTYASGNTSYKAIRLAHQLISEGKASAMITAPISKEAFGLAGVNFPGHTELLAELSGSDKYVMMFLSKQMKAALATIHIPLSLVSSKITPELLEKIFAAVLESLQCDIGLTNPKVAVLGLNPHSGENGNIGREELEVIIPSIKKAGEFFKGPFVPDAFFARETWRNYDAIIGMYHDQALIPFKMLNGGKGVNFTAGLKFIRTSPDHGVAYDIAWKNIADHSSMIEAVSWAEKIAKNRGLS